MKQTLAQLAALLLLVQVATSHAAPPGSDNTKLDITYKVTSQGPLRLDLHYPAAPKAGAEFPLVIFTHGGGWTTGDKTIGDRGVRFRGVSALMAQGLCVASVEYRLWTKDGGVMIRDCVTDSKDALRLLAKNAQRFSLNANRVFTFGDSAGGAMARRNACG